MDRFLYISPAIVAVIVFIYMKNRQAARSERLRDRLKEKQEELVEMLRKNSESGESKK
jgi:hypothetical protein